MLCSFQVYGKGIQLFIYINNVTRSGSILFQILFHHRLLHLKTLRGPAHVPSRLGSAENHHFLWQVCFLLLLNPPFLLHRETQFPSWWERRIRGTVIHHGLQKAKSFFPWNKDLKHTPVCWPSSINSVACRIWQAGPPRNAAQGFTDTSLYVGGSLPNLGLC